MKRLLCLIITLSGCGENDSSDESILPVTLENVVENAIDQRVIAGVRVFSEEVQTLNNLATTFCLAPDDSQLEATQDQWLAVSRRWYQIGSYIFGPLDADLITPIHIFVESMRRGGTDYSATVRDTRDLAISETFELNEEYFASLAFTRVGLLALEATLFETVNPTRYELDEITTEFIDSPRKCEYLLGLVQQLANQAEIAASEWDNIRDDFLSEGLEDATPPEAALLTGVIENLEFLRRRRLLGTEDQRIVSAARPETAPFYSSLMVVLDEIDVLMSGSDVAVGFFELMAISDEEETVVLVQTQLSSAKDAVSANLPDEAAEAFLALETSFREDVPRALGIELGLNFTDGD